MESAVNVSPDQPARIGPWLLEAAVGIDVIPVDQGLHLRAAAWHVVVHNGLGGHAAAGTVLARCASELEAELVAVALWALVDKLRQERGA